VRCVAVDAGITLRCTSARGAPLSGLGPGPVMKPSRETGMSAMIRVMPGETRSAAQTHRSRMKRVADAPSIAPSASTPAPPGRIENAQVAVCLVYAAVRGHAAVDRELYLPRSWTCDPDRSAITGGKPRIRHEDHDLRLEY
jgi:hypothetical protein